MFRFILGAATAAILTSAAPVSAATITIALTPPTSVFNPTPLADDFEGTYFENVSDTVPGQRLNPWVGLPADPAGTYYSSITGWVLFRFADLQGMLTFVWGSPGLDNTLTFFRNNAPVFTMTGADVAGCCGVNLAYSLVTISDIGGFDAVEFRSENAAFEFANVVTPVPLPAGGTLLMAGLGGLAALRRRKRS